MAIFGQYFMYGLLREMGWPRKEGLLRRDVVDALIFDSVVEQMIDWAAGIGAGRPRLALQVIAEMNRDKNWEGPDAPKIKWVIDELRKKMQNDGKMLETVHHMK
ncbi:MAG: hypothetical protein HY973_04125 [Candidatus Kerfeldbacteria bacterium]|nr:hypothetical protein [Candidatus Kerfeldbacteria bacterium]